MDWFKRWIAKRKENKRKQLILERCGCICYCPGCKDILQESHTECIDTDLVRYKCRCGYKSSWFFGAPCPILIEGDSWSDCSEPLAQPRTEER